jgi:hypothetical protein
MPRSLSEVVVIVTGNLDTYDTSLIRAKEAVTLHDAQKSTGRQDHPSPTPPLASSGPQDTVDSIDSGSLNGHNTDKNAVSGHRHTIDNPSIVIDEGNDERPEGLPL